MVLWMGSYIPQLKLDASADSLVLEGDEALDYFREASKRYSSEDFLLVTYRPQQDLLSDQSLMNLTRLRDDLAALQGVSSVASILDVPLLNSPKLALSDITGSDPIPTLSTKGVDRELVRKELQESPIYKGLLTSPDGQTTALQVNLKVDQHYVALLQQRETLREKRRDGQLNAEEQAELKQVEQAFKDYAYEAGQRQSNLVEQARTVLNGYRSNAKLFLGGVPMIAADMVSFVRSDLVTFGSGIVVFVILMLSVIFRQLRWVVLPLVVCASTATFMLGLLTVLDWRMTVISSNFIALLLIISLAISIHLIVRFRELEAAQPEASQSELVIQTVRLMVIPCLYTSLTTIVAFVSLVVSGIRPVIDFGWMMTLGIVAAFVLTFVLLPGMLSLMSRGRAVDGGDEGKDLTLIFAGFTERFGIRILWVSLGLLLATGYGVSRLEVENRFIDYFHESTEIYQGMEVIDAELGGTIPLEIMIDLKQLPDSFSEASNDNSAESVAAENSNEAPLEDGFSDGFDDEFSDGFDDEFSDDFADDFSDGFADDFAEGNAALNSNKQSYWFTVAGLRKIEAVHDYVDSLPETGKVLSLSTLYQVVKDLMGEDVDNVQLALVQNALPAEIQDIMVDPYLISRYRSSAYYASGEGNQPGIAAQ